jgi:hypothetical protein
MPCFMHFSTPHDFPCGLYDESELIKNPVNNGPHYHAQPTGCGSERNDKLSFSITHTDFQAIMVWHPYFKTRTRE